MITTGFRRSHWVAETAAAQPGTDVEIAGWVQRQRDHGGLVFADVRDRTGLVQIVVRPDEGVAFERASTLRPECVVRVRGTVRLRDPDAVNPAMPTGHVEIVANEIEILSRPGRLPFLPTDPGVDESVRLRYRYIDLRRPEMLRNLALRSRLVRAVRQSLDARGFLEIETPTLTRSTPEGARDFLVPSRQQPGRFYALPQSPQLFKQLLMVGGVERYYQIARCYRDEDLRADRQPEFTQIDLEMSFVEPSDVQDVVEHMMADVFRETVGVELTLPLPRLTWREAMDLYGSDKPDLRYALAAQDLTAVARGTELTVLRRACEEGGVVFGMRIADQGALRRRDLDDLAATARAQGAGGLAWIRYDGEQVRSSFGQSAPTLSLTALLGAAGAERGDTLLLAAGPLADVRSAVGAVRQEAARRLGLVPDAGDMRHPALLWVTDFPLFERAADGTYTSAHHPFTAPADSDVEALLAGTGDPLSYGSKAYDLVLNGNELGSGSIRIHRTDVQEAVFRVLGIGPERARDRFGFLLDGLRAGAPPHGGIALGVDRIAMLLAGASSLRDVLAFPKTASGTDPLTDAPAEVDPEQLRELGIRVADTSRV